MAKAGSEAGSILREFRVPAADLGNYAVGGKVGVDLFKKGGYIKNYKLYRQDQRGILRIYLKYVTKGDPVIPAEVEFGRVALQMLLTDAMESSNKAALQQRE